MCCVGEILCCDIGSFGVHVIVFFFRLAFLCHACSHVELVQLMLKSKLSILDHMGFKENCSVQYLIFSELHHILKLQ